MNKNILGLVALCLFSSATDSLQTKTRSDEKSDGNQIKSCEKKPIAKFGTRKSETTIGRGTMLACQTTGFTEPGEISHSETRVCFRGIGRGQLLKR